MEVHRPRDRINATPDSLRLRLRPFPSAYVHAAIRKHEVYACRALVSALMPATALAAHIATVGVVSSD